LVLALAHAACAAPLLIYFYHRGQCGESAILPTGAIIVQENFHCHAFDDFALEREAANLLDYRIVLVLALGANSWAY
jgi:hypothetical protein